MSAHRGANRGGYRHPGLILGLGGLAAVMLVIGIGTGAVKTLPSGVDSGPIDRECYSSVLRHNGVTTMYSIPAPADQPSVKSPDDCRYRKGPTDADGYETMPLDAHGCYGLDRGGSDIVYRPDFCSVEPR